MLISIATHVLLQNVLIGKFTLAHFYKSSNFNILYSKNVIIFLCVQLQCSHVFLIFTIELPKCAFKYTFRFFALCTKHYFSKWKMFSYPIMHKSWLLIKWLFTFKKLFPPFWSWSIFFNVITRDNSSSLNPNYF
jgi:hypothetical protein